MPLRVNNNIIAINTRRQLLINNRELSRRIERLSSGLRINRAADDAAGLSVSEGMRAELVGFRQAVRNAEHGTNLIQTAEGALNEVSAILIRMRELAVQAASSTLNDNNRTALNAEVVQLVSEIDRIATSTSYNNTSLLIGFGNTVSLNATVSTALASNTTGVTDVSITGAAPGTYVFIDSDACTFSMALSSARTVKPSRFWMAPRSPRCCATVCMARSMVGIADRPLSIVLTDIPARFSLIPVARMSLMLTSNRSVDVLSGPI